MAHIWAIADLHLSFGVQNKSMEFFGPDWANWTERLERNWHANINKDDLVLIPGDISWAMRISEAEADLKWIGALPGTKVLIRGNHDYWWESLSKIQSILPPSCHLIQNNSFFWNGIAIAGARLWDTPEYQFRELIDFRDNPRAKKLTDEDPSPDADKIFQREVMRLESSLKAMNPAATLRIAMLHYPPIGADLKDSIVSKLLEKYNVQIAVFGHLHNIKKGLKLFGKHNEIQYELVSADYLDFMPVKLR